MNSFTPPTGFSIWLTLFGYQIALVASSLRKRSYRNELKKELKKDTISQLPDDILISIIDRLSIEEAVRSSILSNRWRSLYKSESDIYFMCDNLVPQSASRDHDSDMIVNGVDRFLRPRSGFKIRSLFLSCCLKDLETKRYEQFIFSVGRLGLESLDLCCSCGVYKFGNVSFSCHLLSLMPTLKYLHLGSCYLLQRPLGKYFDSGLCSMTKLPSLKLTQYSNSIQVFSLGYVNVSEGALECILSNCLSLHSLSTYCCKFSPKLKIRASNKLKCLWMVSCDGVKEIELYASNLVMFEFYSYEVVKFVFEHVPKLESMFLEFWSENTMSRVCTEIIKDLPSLKSLIFYSGGDIFQASHDTMGFNTFGNLRQLSLCLFYDSDYKKVDLLLLAPFLQRCPLLEDFHLDTGSVECEGRKVKTIPEAVIHLKLKKVEITGHGETENEIEFVLHILRSAIRLEQMQISKCTKWYDGWGRWSGRDESSRPAKWYERWGRWLGRLDDTSWGKKTRERIDKELEGQAVSKTARVTVEYSLSFENNWETFDAHSLTADFC